MFLLYTVSRVIEPRMASVGRVEMRLQYIRNIFSENPELSKTGGRQVFVAFVLSAGSPCN